MTADPFPDYPHTEESMSAKPANRAMLKTIAAKQGRPALGAIRSVRPETAVCTVEQLPAHLRSAIEQARGSKAET